MDVCNVNCVACSVLCLKDIQETKIFTMLGEVGMANELTKTTQTSVWMAQHNE